MGCSSSSAQTVEQEKRPGTKPEESNGDTVAVRNGILTDDVPTIEDQMQLPVQTNLPDDLKAGPEDETEAVLVAMEAQEDLGSGEDLLTAPEPQSEPPASEELAPQPAHSAAVEDSAESQVPATVAEVMPPVEEALPVGTVPAEAPPDVKTLEATEETPEAKSVEAMQTEVPVSAEEVVTVPAAEPVLEEPAGTAEVVEEALHEADSKAPTEDAELVQAEAPAGNTTPETVSETPGAGEASTATAISVANEEAAPAEPSGPADAVEPVIYTTIAAASIPEMPPATATEEETEVSTATAVTASPAEVTCPVEVTTAPEPAKAAEAPPVRVSLESSTETGVTAEVYEVMPNMTQTEASPGPEPATEPVPDPSPEVESVNEASKDTEGEIAKKQD